MSNKLYTLNNDAGLGMTIQKVKHTLITDEGETKMPDQVAIVIEEMFDDCISLNGSVVIPLKDEHVKQLIKDLKELIKE